MVKFNIICLITSTVLAMQLCKGENITSTASTNTAPNTVIATTTSTTTAAEAEAIEKGMQGIYKLYQNFLQTVMSENFYTTNSSFSILDLNEIINQEAYGKLQTNWQKLAKTFGGFAACIIFGLMFALFMPLTGCIYCCCHFCCHKCGGTREVKDPTHAKCKRWIYTIILLICATFVLTGGVVTFLGGNLLRKSLINENNQGAIGKMDSNLDKIKTFVDGTFKDVQQTAHKEIIVDGLDTILGNVIGAVNKTVDKIKENINATSLLNEAKQLGAGAIAVKKDLADLNVTLSNLKQLQKNISNVINDTKNNSPNITLTFEPDFSKLSMLDNLASNITNAENITSLVAEAQRSFDNIANQVQKDVNRAIDGTKDQIENVKNTVQSALNKLNDTIKPFTNALVEFRNNTFNNSDLKNIFKMAGDYTWYACIGMGSSVLLVVFFYYIAVVFGLCGERPKRRAPCCNRGTGAGLLFTGITISFWLSFILMLVVIVLFSLGGLGYTMACRYLNGGIEGISTFESVISQGLNWKISKTLNVSNLTLSDMFSNCKDNQGLYQAFHLQSIFNLDEKFNISEITNQVNGIVSINITGVSNISLLSDDLKKQLRTYADSKLESVNFSDYLNMINKPIFGNGTNLTMQIEHLKTLANLPDANISEIYNQSAQKLQHLQDNEIVQLKTEMQNLNRIIRSLQLQGNKTKMYVDNLITNILHSQETFNTRKDNITKQGLQEAVNDIIQTINHTVNSAKAHIESETGRCRGLYDAAQGLVDAVCIVTLNPLNAIWFGLGWALFFYIPCIIFAALLSNLYVRKQPYEKMTDLSTDNDHANNMPLSDYHGKEELITGNGLSNNGYQGIEHQPYNDSYSYMDAHGQQNHIYPQLHNGDPRNHGYGGGYRGYPPQYNDAGPPNFNQPGYGGGYNHPKKY